jgi:hypothetical protein
VTAPTTDQSSRFVVEQATADSFCAKINGAPLDQQSSTLGWLLDFALDTLGADRLEIRVLPADQG